MRRTFLCIGSIAMTALVSCTVSPTWKAPTGITTAQVRLAPGGYTFACIGDKPFHLEPDAQGNVTLPVDERVMLWSNYSWQSGNKTYWCSPQTSFIPRAGEKYTTVFEILPEYHACTYTAYRQTTANRIGLDFEPSARPMQSCLKP